MKIRYKRIQNIFAPLGILVLAVVLSWVLHTAKTAQYAGWLPTEGIITKIEYHHSSSRRSHGSDDSYELHYDYSVAGVSYSGSNRYSGDETERREGERVEVWYDPENPDSASFHKPGPGLYPLVPFIFALPLMLRFLKRKHHRRGSVDRGEESDR